MIYNDNRRDGGNFSMRTPYGYTPGYKANDGRAEFMVPIHTVRQLLSSALVIAGAVCFSLYIILYLAGVFTGEAVSFINTLLSYEDYVISYSPFVIMIISAVCVIPDIILAIGVWLIYSAAAKRSIRSIKTSGLTVIKVITIIKFVVCMILFAAVLFILGFEAVITFTGSQGIISAETAVSKAAAVILPAVAALLCAVFVIYYIMLIKSLTTIKRTVSSGRPSAKISVYVAVISFLFAVCLAASIIAFLRLESIFMAVSGGLRAVSFILFGIFLLIYRSRLRSMTDGMIFY